MALAPEWMSYTTKENPYSQGPRMLGRERERGPKYGKQHSYNNLSTYVPSYSQTHDPERIITAAPFACSLSSPPVPPHVPSILGDNNMNTSRVLNRSKSSPGFGSPNKPKPKRSPDRSFERNFSSSNKPSKLKMSKAPFNPTSYGKSVSQPDLLNSSDRAPNWHQPRISPSVSFSSSPSLSPAPSPTPSACVFAPSPLVTSSAVSSPPSILIPASASPPPLPLSPSPPLVPEIDKLKQLIPNSGPPPKYVRRGVVGPPLPKKAPSATLPLPLPPSVVTNPSGSPSHIVSPNSPSLYFRKATSEPLLTHHKAQIGSAARSKKLRAMETEKAQIHLLKEATDVKQPNRNNFFQHVIQREVSGEPLLEDESPIGNDIVPVDVRPSTPPPPSPPLGFRSPLPEDIEDEERFLRTLGWVPDEEDPVPVLAEEEMADVKIYLSKAKHLQQEDDDGVPLGIDVK